MTASEFEHAVATMLQKNGYHDVQHVGGAGDLGVDVVCRDQDGRKVVVQCKRYNPSYKIRSKDIQTFIGMMTVHHRADRGIFVTTSSFTEEARSLADEHNVRTIEGTALKWMM